MDCGSVYRTIGCQVQVSDEGKSLYSRWDVLTMTPLTQAYHSRCLCFGNAARVVEYDA